MILVEAQSTWTVNILVRALLYLVQSYHEYFQRTCQDYYKSRKVKMPEPELYVIFTGNKGRKPDIISLSKDFFEGADVDIEVKAKVIYECDTDDIINQYIIFCKVFNEQTGHHGITQKAVTKTICICKDRNVLREYLAEREKVIVIKSERHAADRETAERMIKMGRLSLDEIALCVPSLSLAELKELKAEVMQLAIEIYMLYFCGKGAAHRFRATAPLS